MIRRFLIMLIPIVLFLLTSTSVLFLSFVNIKYTYEPVLTGTAFDFLIDNTYSMAWLFYGVTNIAFIVIYSSVLLFFYKLNWKHHI